MEGTGTTTAARRAEGESIDVVVIGAGQAGLATSHELTQAGVRHVVFERGHVGQTWRDRWHSFCLVTPNWSVSLPGHPYDGDDPDGYMARDEIVEYLQRYAAGFAAPLREGIEVTSLERLGDGRAERFLIQTSQGLVRARTVVVSTGAYQRPYRPPGASTLPPDLPQIDIEQYRDPATLPSGKVLVVGSGQSGCQLSEELGEAGREVFLACGKAPWVPRRIGDHDVVWWLVETGFLDQPVGALPGPEARLAANPTASGHGRGHDLTLRTLRRDGTTLLGHFLGAEGRRARFAADLAESMAWGDERYGQVMGLVRKLVAERGLPAPDIVEPEPFDGRAPEILDLAGFGAVVFAGGFRPDYGRWVRVPGAFDEMGFPVHSDGASTAAAGLYFVGVHFLRTRKSSLLYGVGEDAAVVARQIAAAQESG
jgi:putative flavoprotein involved in K+ transport